MGYVDPMKVQDKGLNAPVLWTVMGTLQMPSMEKKEEALSPETIPTLWFHFVLLIPHFHSTMYLWQT